MMIYMNIREVEHRDSVLRSYFKGRDWDQNSEFRLKQKLVLNSSVLLAKYPYVIEDEWEVIPDRSSEGKGDLVFTDAFGCFAVVEVKYINLTAFGGNSSTKRTSKRKTVKEQALMYAKYYFNSVLDNHTHTKQVTAFIFTNESTLPVELK